MAKPNFQFEKRQRELEQKRKKEEKKRRKLEQSQPRSGENPDAGDEQQSPQVPPPEGT